MITKHPEELLNTWSLEEVKKKEGSSVSILFNSHIIFPHSSVEHCERKAKKKSASQNPRELMKLDQ